MLRQSLNAANDIEQMIMQDAEGNDLVLGYHIEIHPNQ